MCLDDVRKQALLEPDMISVLTMDELELIKVDLDYIKNLPAPPQAIKDTMEAVTLLLGYPPRQARNWSFIRQLCNRGPLLNKMHEFQCEEVNLNLAKKARNILSLYDRNMIMSKSCAAVSVFIWAESTMTEVDAYLDARMELIKGRKIP
ncbi:uncharacterized protein LOC125672096 [Ostrea edulis]|uniref:uncharacterized protein LOC125672096 n=1 Tax=Ostrea edulis TaxID=37623 RepID=UPI002094A741|nr:uncharacterized protein LOC125672096 [Ostrea edulis]